MKKRLLFTIQILLVSRLALAQPVGSFYLDAAPGVCYFSVDAIYFSGNSLIKTDYSGNVLWTKSPNPFGRLAIQGNAIYGTDHTNVFKLDTAGNSIWAKNFSAPIPGANSFPNYVTDVIPSCNKLFVCIQRGHFDWQSYDTCSQAIITMDTSGNIINAVIDTNFTIEEQTVGFPSVQGGAWLGYIKLTQSFHLGSVKRIDSTGNFDHNSCVVTCPGTEAYLQNIMPLPDSTYIIVFDIYDSSPDRDIYCGKMNENGCIIWVHIYTGINLTGNYVYNSAVDSAGNIYIVAEGSPCDFAVKLDSSGKVLWRKGWTHPNNSFRFYYNNFYAFNTPGGLTGSHYKDGKIYCYGLYKNSKPAIMIFDTAFDNPCYVPDTNILLSEFPYSNSNSIWNYNGVPFSYSASNTTFSSITNANPSKLDLCMAIGIPAISENDLQFSVYPNPVNAQLIVSSTMFAGGGIEMVDVLGNKIQCEQLQTPNLKLQTVLNVSSLPNGVYFIRPKSGEQMLSKKIVVVH